MVHTTGKVALITGAARGQGRSHARHLAQAGADIIALDICRDYDTLDYPMSREADLDETADMVRALGRRCVTSVVDVRDRRELDQAVHGAVGDLGRLDIVCANAGISMARTWHEVSDALWRDVIETNLTGVWNTISVAAPHLIRAGGGAIVVVGSVAGHKGQPWMVPYCAAKHGLTGLVKSMALELAKHDVRINIVSPTGVDTPMATALAKTIGDLAGAEPALGTVFMNTLSVEVIDPSDVSNAVLYLASDAARYVTGADLTVDAGNSIR